MNILKEQLRRTKELMGVLNEQRTFTVMGQKVSREEYYDYTLRNFLHITTKAGTFGKEYEYRKSYIDDLTDEEKEQYCKLLSDEFLTSFDFNTVFDAPFEGDTTC